MAGRGIFRKALGIGLVVGGTAAVYQWMLKPWLLTRGASEEELSRRLPGDELLRSPKWSFTQAITVHASPDEIWPWLLQWGYQRGGFYSYGWLDRMMESSGMKSANRILPQFQDLQVGDRVPIEPSGGGFVVYGMKDECYLLLGNRVDLKTMKPFSHVEMKPEQYLDATWVLYLNPDGEDRTRLISRARLDTRFSPAMNSSLFADEMLKVSASIMDWGVLNGIKCRAEGSCLMVADE